MSASTNILSFTDLDGDTQKITSIAVMKVVDASSYRIIQTFVPTKKYRVSDSLSAIQTEAGSLFTATEGGVDILLNSILIKHLFDYNNQCQILFQGGEKITVDETVSVIEGRIDAVSDVEWGDIGGTLSDQTDLQAALDAKANDAISFKTKSSDYTLLISDDIVEFSAGEATLPDATTLTKELTITANGSDIPLNTTGSDTIMGESDGLISDGSTWTVFPNGTNFILR